MKHRLWAFVVAFLCYSSIVFAERQDILLNNQWKFRFSHQVQKGTEVRVDLPHTWNAQDALSGKIDYKRGIGNYEKKLFVQSQWKGKRLFLRFEGVNSIVLCQGSCEKQRRSQILGSQQFATGRVCL